MPGLPTNIPQQGEMSGIQDLISVMTAVDIQRKAHAPKQVLESRGRANCIKSWLYVEENDAVSAFLVGFFQPGEGLIVLAQACIDEGQVVSRDGSMF